MRSCNYVHDLIVNKYSLYKKYQSLAAIDFTLFSVGNVPVVVRTHFLCKCKI